MPASNLGTPGCVNWCNTTPGSTCPPGPSLWNYSTWQSYTIKDIVNKLSQSELKVWKWSYWIAKFASLPYLMFDKSNFDTAKNGVQSILQFKNIPQFHTLSEDWVSVMWWEEIEALQEAYVDQASTWNVVKIKTQSSIQRFFVKDSILIFSTSDTDACCSTETNAIITAVDILNLTLTLNKAVNVKAWDRILRMFNTIQQCEEFENQATLNPTDYFRSYYQYFGWKLEFTNDELNISYATPGWAEDVIRAKMQSMYQILFMDVGNAYWRGLNIKEVKWVQAAQTMWVLPSIYKQVELGKNFVHDLRLKTVDLAKVKALNSIFMEAQKAQVEWVDSTLVVAGNNKFWEALSKLNTAWNQLTGTIPVRDNAKEIAFEVRVVNTVLGRIEFYCDFFLEYYYPNKSFAVVMPKNMSAMYMPMNQRPVFSAGWVTMEKVVPGFKVIDLSARNIGKIDCWSGVEFWSRFWFIHAGTSTGAYRIIENLN